MKLSCDSDNLSLHTQEKTNASTHTFVRCERNEVFQLHLNIEGLNGVVSSTANVNVFAFLRLTVNFLAFFPANAYFFSVTVNRS